MAHGMSLKGIARWIPAAAIVACSWTLSSMPTIEQMPQFWNADKLVHTICYGGLAFWMAFGADGTPRDKKWRWAIPMLITAAYGMVDEAHQSFTPGRDCSLLDWAADVCGACLGSWAYGLVADFVTKLRERG